MLFSKKRPAFHETRFSCEKKWGTEGRNADKYLRNESLMSEKLKKLAYWYTCFFFVVWKFVFSTQIMCYETKFLFLTWFLLCFAKSKIFKGKTTLVHRYMAMYGSWKKYFYRTKVSSNDGICFLGEKKVSEKQKFPTTKNFRPLWGWGSIYFEEMNERFVLSMWFYR